MRQKWLVAILVQESAPDSRRYNGTQLQLAPKRSLLSEKQTVNLKRKLLLRRPVKMNLVSNYIIVYFLFIYILLQTDNNLGELHWKLSIHFNFLDLIFKATLVSFSNCGNANVGGGCGKMDACIYTRACFWGNVILISVGLVYLRKNALSRTNWIVHSEELYEKRSSTDSIHKLPYPNFKVISFFLVPVCTSNRSHHFGRQSLSCSSTESPAFSGVKWPVRSISAATLSLLSQLQLTKKQHHVKRTFL